ncbi:MAG: helix-turn-helix domain-containing protein [Clostridia bacterium]|jgi:transcriptional regulator with XRE-family HTH domain|nr:helix-turn-helix domain-containing protein [Clostridia bacterium]
MNDDIIEKFGKWLADKRHTQELSIRAMAAKIGIEPSYYCKIENGLRNDLRLSTIKKIDKAVPVKDFIISYFSTNDIDKTCNK